MLCYARLLYVFVCVGVYQCVAYVCGCASRGGAVGEVVDELRRSLQMSLE